MNRMAPKNTSSINININLNLQAQANSKVTLAGKKINNAKELFPMDEELTLRPNITLESLRKFKNIKSKQPKWQHSMTNYPEDEQPFNEQKTQVELQKNIQTLRCIRRNKSTSLNNFHQAKFKPNTLFTKDKSKSKTKSASKSISKSKQKSKSNKKSNHSKSKSKSPYHDKSGSLKKKSARHGNRIKVSKFSDSQVKSKDFSPFLHKNKSFARVSSKTQKIRQQNSKSGTSSKMMPKHQRAASKKGAFVPNRAKSVEKLPRKLPDFKTNKTPIKQKNLTKGKIQNKNIKKISKKTKNKHQKQAKPNQQAEWAAAITIQSFWRGYATRKKLRKELQQISNRINEIQSSIKKKQSPFWEDSSNNSICKLEVNEVSVGSNSNQKQQSNYQEEMTKMVKKIQEQEDRLKRLEEQKNMFAQLAEKLAKPEIAQQESEEQQQKSQITLSKNKEVINDEGNSLQKFKKIFQQFDCSPRQQVPALNKSLISSMMRQKKQDIENRLNSKFEEHRNNIMNSLVSPKTYNIKCEELEKFFRSAKEKSFQKLKEAETALQIVAEIDDDSLEEQFLPRKEEKTSEQEQKLSKRIKITLEKWHKQEDPKKKSIAIKIDDEDTITDEEKYKLSEQSSLLFAHVFKEKKQINGTLNNSDYYSPLKSPGRLHEHLLIDIPTKPLKSPEKELQLVQKPSEKLQLQVASRASFQTNLNYLFHYLASLCEYIVDSEQISAKIIEKVSEPIKWDALQFLKSYRTPIGNYDDQICYPFFKLIFDYERVLPIELLLTFQNEVNSSEEMAQLREDDRKESEEQGYSLYELKEYHDMSIFDAFNQALDCQRPAGLDGSNLETIIHKYSSLLNSRLTGKLKDPDIPHEAKKQYLQMVLGRALSRVIDCGKKLCGMLIDEEDEEIEAIVSEQKEERKNKEAVMISELIMSEELECSLEAVEAKMLLEIKVEEALIKEFCWEIFRINLKL